MISYVLKKLPFWRNYTTSQHKIWWAKRKMDWVEGYLKTYNHPHRAYIIQVLRMFPWLSLLEIGCGPGANLVNIVKFLPGRQIGGIDISQDAIDIAVQTFKGGFFKVNSADDIMMSDDSVDVVLSDMCLIYAGPVKIHDYIKEIKRIARKKIVLCEFHTTSIFKRWALRVGSGYNAHDYKKLLGQHGFYDIQVLRLPKEAWPTAKDDDTLRHIIIANVPKK